MQLDSELGVLETEDVEATLQRHFEDIRACYQRAGKAQRYAGGRVLLRFMVNGDGAAQDVLVFESTLGNYDVERCLVEVGPPHRLPGADRQQGDHLRVPGRVPLDAIRWRCSTSTG